MENPMKKLINFLQELGVDPAVFERIEPSTDPEAYILSAFAFHPGSTSDVLVGLGFSEIDKLKHRIPGLHELGFLEHTKTGYQLTERGYKRLERMSLEIEYRKN